MLSAYRTQAASATVEAEAPRPIDLAVDAAATLKAAVIPVVMHHAKSEPLARPWRVW